MTLEKIPQGAFVCELVGQYVDSRYLSQNLNSKIKSILDENIRDDETARFNELLENHIMPLSLWGAGVSNSRPAVAAVPEKVTVDVDVGPVVIHIDCENDAEKEVESDIEDNTVEVSEDTMVGIVQNLVQDPQSDTAQHSDVKKLEEILGGQICIDCNTFGNIARFIRRRKKERKGSKNGIGNISSNSSQQMLKQKLIYSNAGDRRFPRLALFAAHYIPANTELLI